MIGIELLAHPMTIVNYVIACRIIAMIIYFLMKTYLQKYVD